MSGPNRITGGNFQDFEGQVLANGYLTLQLSHDAQESVGPGQVVAGFPRRVPLDANGNIAGTVLVWPNDQLDPANTYYIVNAYRRDGTLAWAAPQFETVASSPSPFNVGVWIPTNPPSGGAPVGSILLQNNGTNNESQSILNLESTDSSITITDEGSGNINLQSSGGGGGVLKKWPGLWSSFQVTGIDDGSVTEGAQQGFNLEEFNFESLGQNGNYFFSFQPSSLSSHDNAGFDDINLNLTGATLEDWFTRATIFPEVGVAGSIQNGRYWIGMWDGAAGAGIGLVTDTPAANVIAFRFASQTDTNIQAVCGTPSALTVVDTGIAPPSFTAASNWSSLTSYSIGDIVLENDYNYVAVSPSLDVAPGSNPSFWTIQDSPQIFEIVPTAGGTVITFYINGNLVATIDANVPNPGVPMRSVLALDNYAAGSSNAWLNVYYMFSLSTP